MINLEIKRRDETLPFPKYETTGAAAFDLYSRIDIEITPNTIQLIPLNIIARIPQGYCVLLLARSSTPLKKGLMAANGIGLIDSDFNGPDDEWHFEAYNFTDQPVILRKGDRLAQGLLLKTEQAAITAIVQTTGPSRGGFGTTG